MLNNLVFLDRKREQINLFEGGNLAVPHESSQFGNRLPDFFLDMKSYK
jgi:hypothetical protein